MPEILLRLRGMKEMNIISKSESLKWYLPLMLVVALATMLLFLGLRGELPYISDPDEPTYWLWALLIRQTGSAATLHGGGYPPAFLFLLIVEKYIAEAITGVTLLQPEHILLARYVNAFIAVLTIPLSALIVRRLSSSRLAGIIAALALSLDPTIMVQSRRAAAQAPWLFFTLLCFLFVFIARNPLNYQKIYLSYAAGVVSLLFKYQSGIILLLPLLAILRYDRNRKRAVVHLGLLSLFSGLVLFWLIYGYGIFQIVDTPNSSTRAILSRQNPFQLISLNTNFPFVFGRFDEYFYVTGFLGLLALLLLYRLKKIRVDAEALVFLFSFCVLFYLLMSLFYRDLLSSWLPVFAVILFMWSTSIAAMTAAVAKSLVRFFGARMAPPSDAVRAVLAIVICLPYFWPQLAGWQADASNLYKPYTAAELGNWFISHVPEGARTVAEVLTPFNVYAGFPGRKIYHSLVVNSIFKESIEEYRFRGYEYLIWTSERSPEKQDRLADLDTPQARAYLRDATELLRLAGTEYRGPDIVVFKLRPIQQHIRYLWFTDAISFRGYDLNQETFNPGDTLELMLYWTSAERTTANYIVFVHLLFDDEKTLLVGQDGPPDYGNRPTWKWEGDMQFIRDQRLLSIPADAPPGKYILRMGMYDADTKLRAQITSPQGQPFGDTLTLQEIEIEK